MVSAFIPLALSLAPMLGRWLGGATGETVASAASQVIAEATGADTPEAANAALIANPELRAQVTIRLAEIAAERADAARAAELEALRVTLADVASARAHTVQLTRAGSALAWGAPIVSVIVLAAFGGVMWLAMFRPIPAGSEAILNILLGTLAAMSTSVVSYWVGSSAGSAEKNRLLAGTAPPLVPGGERRS